LTYNQKYSAKSQLYFAGEGFSVEGGWTEPALRGALDAVVHLLQNKGGQFCGNFKFSDYPQYTYSVPTNPYPSMVG
jgi:tryptophan 2-monooxygenase